MNMLLSVLFGMIIAGLLAGLYLFWNTTRVKEEQVQVRLRGLPPEFAGYRIAHISDLHLEKSYVSANKLKTWIEKIRPDLIVMTGDCAETAKGVRKAARYLQSLQAPHGFLAVFGNHEYNGSRKLRSRLEQVYRQLGIRLLRNESVRIERAGSQLQIVGIDDYCTSHENLQQSFAGCRKDCITLVITHDPNVALELDGGVDYALGGHFHGGQINVPGVFKLHPMGDLPSKGIVCGTHQINGNRWYISRGLGQVRFPFRFRAFPELTLHELIPDN